MSPPVNASCRPTEPASPSNAPRWPAAPGPPPSPRLRRTDPRRDRPPRRRPETTLLRLLIEEVNVTGWHVEIRCASPRPARPRRTKPAARPARTTLATPPTVQQRSPAFHWWRRRGSGGGAGRAWTRRCVCSGRNRARDFKRPVRPRCRGTDVHRQQRQTGTAVELRCHPGAKPEFVDDDQVVAAELADVPPPHQLGSTRQPYLVL